MLWQNIIDIFFSSEIEMKEAKESTTKLKDDNKEQELHDVWQIKSNIY